MEFTLWNVFIIKVLFWKFHSGKSTGLSSPVNTPFGYVVYCIQLIFHILFLRHLSDIARHRDILMSPFCDLVMLLSGLHQQPVRFGSQDLESQFRSRSPYLLLSYSLSSQFLVLSLSFCFFPLILEYFQNGCKLLYLFYIMINSQY